MTISVLHVSDFHLGEPDDVRDYLRPGYYVEYIDGLVGAFERAGFADAISCIVATGDFVDKGQTGRFGHAEEILTHLAGRVGVAPTSIVTCIGNHDIDRPLDEAGRPDEAREAYRKFTAPLANGRMRAVSATAMGETLESSLGALAIDATRGGRGQPGVLEEDEPDLLMKWIRETSPESAAVLICSHFPVDVWANRLDAFEEPGGTWQLKHIWGAGGILRERLVDSARSPVLWLSGDVHRDTEVQDGNVAFCTTGRLGVPRARGGGEESRRQASVVQIVGPTEFRLWRAEFRPSGGHGEWHARPKEWTRIERPERVRQVGSRGHEPIALQVAPGEPELISPEFQEIVLQQIAEDGLYRFGRFETGLEGIVCLGWIDVEELCGLSEFLFPAVKLLTRWLKGEIIDKKAVDPRDLLVLGMDCWGSILGSQVAVKAQARFLPVATRAEGRFSSVGEMIDDDVVASIRRSRVVVLVTDIVATGRSLRWVFDRVRTVMGSAVESVHWCAMSLVCDSTQVRRASDLAFLSRHGCLCVDLRMPLLEDALLPPKSILPANISLR